MIGLQTRGSDWRGARKTLSAKLKYGSLPKDIHKRRDAVLSRSEAFLKSNDLEKSLFELAQLEGIASKVMEPWRISAESRIESLLAIEQLVKSIEK